MTNQEDKKIDWLKYLNTFILTFILGFAMMIFITIKNVQNEQILQGKELVRQATVQASNVLSISVLNSRVSALELNQAESIRAWVELNFQRRVNK